VQIFGGAGYIADYGIERFYRDVRLFRLYEGTTQIQQLVIARHMLQEARAETAYDLLTQRKEDWEGDET
jgi:acyl-CoA dehydrogenase